MYASWLVVFILIIRNNLGTTEINQLKLCTCASWNTSNLEHDMNINNSCIEVFIDKNSNLYCSLTNEHRVSKVQFNSTLLTVQSTIVAGTGCPGPISNMLHHPHGIFIDMHLNLYVADTDNNRIQMFPVNEFNAITVAGFGSDAEFLLNRPTAIVVDIDSSLFIVENLNHRIVRSTPFGFQCIVGCLKSHNQLQYPQTMHFDAQGNILVTDMNNSRSQKFILAKNSCISTIENSSWIKISGGGDIINGGIGGAGQLWVVSKPNRIWYRVHLKARWLRISGSLTYISVGAAGHVFGVDMYDQIFYRSNASNSNPKGYDWIQIDGKAIQVAVTSTGGVWAITRLHDIFYRTGINGNWELIDGNLQHISVGVNGEVWGVTKQEDVYYREGSSNAKPKGDRWQIIQGRGTCITVGGHGQIWIANIANDIWFKKTIDVDWIIMINGNLSFITVAPNGLLLGVDIDGYIFYRQNTIIC